MRAAREIRQRVEVVGPDRVLEPERLELLQRAHEALRRRQAPQPVQLDHDVHGRADGAADLAERLQAAVQVPRCDVGAAARLGVRIEWPDLHGRDVLAQQVGRELVGPGEEGVEVLIGALRAAQAPVVDALLGLLADVPVARTGVVDGDVVPARAAKKLVQWPARGVPQDVPQCDVHRGAPARLCAAARIADVARERRGVPLDVERVLAEQVRRGRLVDVRLDGPAAQERFPEADDALVGADLDPEDVGELPQAQRLNLDDLHNARPFLRGRHRVQNSLERDGRPHEALEFLARHAVKALIEVGAIEPTGHQEVAFHRLPGPLAEQHPVGQARSGRCGRRGFRRRRSRRARVAGR